MGPIMSEAIKGRKHYHLQGSKWIRPEKREAIRHRHGDRCVYCEHFAGIDGFLHLDHMNPRSGGVDNSEENLVTSCNGCNSRKKDLSFGSWLSFLAIEGFDIESIVSRIRLETSRPLDKLEGRRRVERKKADKKSGLIAAQEAA